jgi:hypothetical protein
MFITNNFTDCIEILYEKISVNVITHFKLTATLIPDNVCSKCRSKSTFECG